MSGNSLTDKNSRSEAGPERSVPPRTASVLQDVQSRRRQRRKRSRTPAWVLWGHHLLSRTRQLMVVTIPEYVATHRQELLTTGVSFAAHVFIAVVLAAWMLPAGLRDEFGILATRVEPLPDSEAAELTQVVQPEKLQDLQVDSRMQQLISDLDNGRTTDVLQKIQDQELALDLDPTDADMRRLFKQGDFGGRVGVGRKAAVKEFGGNAESELAVNLGLEWLSKIQREDGSWSFGEVGPEAQAGTFGRTDMGATSMALLCFLGAGHNHVVEGPYRELVEKGLRYLGQNTVVVQRMADLRGTAQGHSGMYVQGLAAIVLSEAHALAPDDVDVKKLAQMAVDFIERAQDPVGGGWRYQPREPGDTSVAGWQIMALQSAKAGGLRVNSSTLREARDFLRSVQTHDGARYGYRPRRDSSPAMTAVGLLCRMYLGWRQDNESLQQGVAYLAALGPRSDDIYHNYYAAQVLHHWGGELWEKWNPVMRDQLVQTQIRQGPAAGTWPVTDPHGDPGGTLYQTTLSILTLEVYYRHLPLYRNLDQ